jgi:hypothetical protein
MSETEQTSDDHDDIRDAVRSAIEQNRSDPPDSSVLQEISDENARNVFEAADRVADVFEDKPSGQQRDARGRFQTKATTADSPQPENWSQHRGPPTSWSERAKAEWEKLSPELRDAVIKREGEIQNGSQRFSEERQRLNDFEAVLGPRRQSYQRHGFQNDAQAVEFLFSWNDAYERAPAETVLRMVQTMPPAERQKLGQALGVAASQPQFTQEQTRQLSALVEQRANEIAETKYRAMQGKQQRTVQKVRASNASLNGAPYGVGSAPRSNGHAKGTFGDIASDVRNAIDALR